MSKSAAVAAAFALGWLAGEAALATLVAEIRALGEEVVCPACGGTVGWRPEALLLVLGCPSCRSRKVWAARSVVPLALATAFSGVVLLRGVSLDSLWLFSALFLGATTLLTDVSLLLIPDYVPLGFLLAGLVRWGLALGWKGLTVPLAGAALWGLAFFLIYAVSRGGMGFGDVKLAAGLGAFLGAKLGAVAVFAASVVGGGVGIFLLLGGAGRKTKIPFGPFLVLGGIVALVWGEPILRLYLAYLGR